MQTIKELQWNSLKQYGTMTVTVVVIIWDPSFGIDLGNMPPVSGFEETLISEVLPYKYPKRPLWSHHLCHCKCLRMFLTLSRKRSQSWDFKGLQSSCSPGITCLLRYRLQRLRQLHLPRRHQGYKSSMYKFCVPKPPSNIGSQFVKWVKCITCLETHDHVGM